MKYKKTGIDWMPEIPEHWKIQRAKIIFVERSIKNKPNEPLLAASQTKGVVLKNMLEQRSMEAIQNFETFKLVEKNDFVISLRSFEGGIELAYFKGIISPVYNIFRSRKNDSINVNYYKYIFKSSLFIQELNVYKTGIRDGQSISYKNFGNILLPIPPLSEQQKVSEFLDAQTAKITRFIQSKQRFIELLKEQRQSIITQAVTKGLNYDSYDFCDLPDSQKNQTNHTSQKNHSAGEVKMKETGIDWIGKVPEHWKVCRIKFVGESFIGLTYSPTEIVDKEKGILVLRSSNIQNGRLSLLDNVYVKKEIPEKLKTKKGDILLCSRNGSAELIGKNIMIDEESENQTFGAFMTIFRSSLNHYLYYFFNSNIFLSQTSLFGTSTVNQLTNDILSNLVVAFPTELEEQEKIIEHIKTETRSLDIAISKAEREIELIKEYREAMIAEAVTGKMSEL